MGPLAHASCDYILVRKIKPVNIHQPKHLWKWLGICVIFFFLHYSPKLNEKKKVQSVLAGGFFLSKSNLSANLFVRFVRYRVHALISRTHAHAHTHSHHFSQYPLLSPLVMLGKEQYISLRSAPAGCWQPAGLEDGADIDMRADSVDHPPKPPIPHPSEPRINTLGVCQSMCVCVCLPCLFSTNLNWQEMEVGGDLS